MQSSKSSRPRERKPRALKTFTDYPMPLAFERIEFYLRVLEAHFEKLGAPRRKPEEEESPREAERAAAPGG